LEVSFELEVAVAVLFERGSNVELLAKFGLIVIFDKAIELEVVVDIKLSIESLVFQTELWDLGLRVRERVVCCCISVFDSLQKR